MLRLVERVNLRISAKDRAAWKAAATADGKSLSEWIKRRVWGDAATPPPRLTPASAAQLAVAEAAPNP